MTKFADIFKADKPRFSLEFFPPKKEAKLPSTLETIKSFSELQPDFMTCTYGAGGGTRELTAQIVKYMVQELNVPAVAHLTCVGHSKADLDQILDSWSQLGIKMILALRGDPPRGQEKFEAHPDGFSCARDLVKHVKDFGNFSVAVAGYPEVHPEAISKQADIDYLKEKVDAGAEVVVTQLFFEASMYESFLESSQKAGIDIPIVPGVMPVGNVKQLKRFSEMCGCTIPIELQAKLDSIQEDPDAVTKFGTEYATQLSQDLISLGAPGIHLYTLNSSVQVDPILRELIKTSS